jgi:hypothetical protein
MRQEGIYFGYLNSVVIAESSQKGTPYIGLQFRVPYIQVGKEYQSIPEGTCEVQFYLSPAAHENSERQLKKLGMVIVEGNAMPEFPELTEKGTQLRCKHEAYKGIEHERWDIGGGPTPLDATSTRTLLARFKAAGIPTVAAKPASAVDPIPDDQAIAEAASTTPAPPPKPEEQPEEGLPF